MVCRFDYRLRRGSPVSYTHLDVYKRQVRQGFSRDMADMLLNDIKNAICEFEKLEYPTPGRKLPVLCFRLPVVRSKYPAFPGMKYR